MKNYIMVAKIEKFKHDAWFEVRYVNLDTGVIMIDDGLSFTDKTFYLDTGVELKVVEEQGWSN